MSQILFWPYEDADIERVLALDPKQFQIVGTGARRQREETRHLYDRRGSVALDPCISAGGVYMAVAQVCKIRIITGFHECRVQARTGYWRGK